MLNDFALIIGVEDYRTYDRTGAANVSGAVNDARTHFRQCMAAGFSPERIRVLTSPKLSPADLGPGASAANVGEATGKAVAEGIAWIARALAHTPISGTMPGAAGLVTFSGNGLVGQGTVLCPADFDGTAGSFVRVSDVLGAVPAAHARNLTLLLDCRHALSDAIAAAEPVAQNEVHRTPARVLAACSDDQTSVSSTFGGQKMGAFTWAVTSALGPCKTSEPGGLLSFGITYGELLSRTRSLLSALSFPQVTVLEPAILSNVGFMRPLCDQLVPNQYVLTLFDALGKSLGQLGQICAVGTNTVYLNGNPNDPLVQNSEYWNVDDWVVKNELTNAAAIRISTTGVPSAFDPHAYLHGIDRQSYAQNFYVAEYSSTDWPENPGTVPLSDGTTSVIFTGTTYDPLGNEVPMALQLLYATSSGTIYGIGWFVQTTTQPTSSYTVQLLSALTSPTVATDPPATTQSVPLSSTYYGMTQQGSDFHSY